jgi:prolyl 4-hydroxylase
MIPRMNPPVLFTLPAFLRPAECAAWIELAAAQGFAEAPVTTKLGPLMMPEARNNTRVMLDDVPGTEGLWSRLQPHVAPCQRSDGTWLPVGLNERLRFYRYEPGQMFRWHRDGAFVRDARERSLLTFIVYLDEGCVGGETEFEDRVVTPARGMALIFSHHLLHQGALVREGVKHVLRSDVMYRLS